MCSCVLVSTIGCSLGRLCAGAKEALVGLLVTIAIGVEATRAVVLAGLSAPLSRGLYPHQVVVVESAASGRVVQGPSLWSDEGVGAAWCHE